MKSSLYTSAKIRLRTMLGIKTAREYQERRSPMVKFNLIFDNIDPKLKSKSVLDIGCNAGMITAAFADKGMFSVGIDINPRILPQLDKRPVIGFYNLNADTLDAVPSFDVLLLLSVHHQWVLEKGDEYTQDVIARLIGKANHYFVLEFASINEKYGYDPHRFEEGNEESLKQYYESWLQQCNTIFRKHFPDQEFSFSFLGRNAERKGVEEFRYIYLIRKKH
jgi:SAM-dependent methyltransferase